MKAISVICLCLFCSYLSATPSWYLNNVSTAETLIGNGCGKIEAHDEETAIQKAEEDALNQLARQIFCEVETQTTLLEQESGAGKKVLSGQYYRKEIQVRSSLSLCNYTVSRKERENQNYFVQVSVSRYFLTEYYKDLVKKELEKINGLATLAQMFLDKHDKQAVSQYQKLRSELDELDRSICILQAVTGFRTDLSAQLKDLPKQTVIDSLILQLSGNYKQDYPELAEDIIRQITLDLKPNDRFMVYPYEWGATGFASEFGASLAQFLAGELARNKKLSQARKETTPDITVLGQIVESGKSVYLITRILTSSQEQTIRTTLYPASCEYYGWDKIKPVDLEDKLADQQVLKQRVTASGKLKAEISSLEFGRNPAVYYYRDEPTLLVRANQACYLSVLYIESDGTKTVLIQNYRIGADQANEWIKLPVELCACAPAGVEQLLLQADVVKLPVILTYKKDCGDGMFKDIATEGLQAVATTRGMCLKEKQSQFTEDALVWTILPKRK